MLQISLLFILASSLFKILSPISNFLFPIYLIWSTFSKLVQEGEKCSYKFFFSVPCGTRTKRCRYI